MSSPAAPTSPAAAVSSPGPSDTVVSTTRDLPTSTTDVAPTTPATSAAPSSSSNPVTSSSSSSASPSASTSSTTSAGPSSTSSTKPSSASSSPSSKASLTSSISFVVQTSNGQVFTQTSVITLPAFTPTQSSSNQSSTSFFHNTGAVAGVFSVVGVISLVVIFFLLTSFVRRRRARQLDREIDEAAAVAANAQVPDFDDFDYTSGTGIGYGPYSETSHGTYNQPPLSHERSRNNLGDIPPSFDSYNSTGGPGSGAAGIGARGRSVRGGGVPDPFGALANPPEQYEMNETRRSWHQGTLRGGTEVTTYDLLQAAGLSGSDPYAVTRGASTRLAHNPSLSGMSGLTRNQSQGASSLLTSAESYPMPTPAPAYPGGQDRPYPSEKQRYSASYAPGGGMPTMPSGGDADVYGGYQDQPSVQLDNPHSPGLGPPAPEDEHEEVVEQYEHPYSHGPDEPARASLADDEDYGYNIGHRVLRVANE